jgi:hypothetical protein
MVLAPSIDSKDAGRAIAISQLCIIVRPFPETPFAKRQSDISVLQHSWGLLCIGARESGLKLSTLQMSHFPGPATTMTLTVAYILLTFPSTRDLGKLRSSYSI